MKLVKTGYNEVALEEEGLFPVPSIVPDWRCERTQVNALFFIHREKNGAYFITNNMYHEDSWFTDLYFFTNASGEVRVP